jgi:hypothetical protein
MTILMARPEALLAAEEVVNELPLPSWAIGAGALGLLLVLLIITLSFNKR